MQFSTVFAFVAAATMAVALPQASPAQQASCSVGTPQCCNSMLEGADASRAAALLGLSDIVGSVGLQCQHVPVNIIGAAVEADNNCKSTPVCCTNTASDGLFHLGCNPVSVN